MEKSSKGRKQIGLNNKDKFADWQVGPHYEVLKLIGQGSYGAVAKALHVPSGKEVAIKQMKGVFEDVTDCKRILREISILKEVKSNYIVELFDLIPPQDSKHFDTIYVVLTLSESDLKKIIKSAIFLEKGHVSKIIFNLLCGLQYIHTANIIHRDLKPANVLIHEDCSVKLCDFGLSRSLQGVES